MWHKTACAGPAGGGGWAKRAAREEASCSCVCCLGRWPREQNRTYGSTWLMVDLPLMAHVFPFLHSPPCLEQVLQETPTLLPCAPEHQGLHSLCLLLLRAASSFVHFFAFCICLFTKLTGARHDGELRLEGLDLHLPRPSTHLILRVLQVTVPAHSRCH